MKIILLEADPVTPTTGNTATSTTANQTETPAANTNSGNLPQAADTTNTTQAQNTNNNANNTADGNTGKENKPGDGKENKTGNDNKEPKFESIVDEIEAIVYDKDALGKPLPINKKPNAGEKAKRILAAFRNKKYENGAYVNLADNVFIGMLGTYDFIRRWLLSFKIENLADLNHPVLRFFTNKNYKNHPAKEAKGFIERYNTMLLAAGYGDGNLDDVDDSYFNNKDSIIYLPEFYTNVNLDDRDYLIEVDKDIGNNAEDRLDLIKSIKDNTYKKYWRWRKKSAKTTDDGLSEEEQSEEENISTENSVIFNNFIKHLYRDPYNTIAKIIKDLDRKQDKIKPLGIEYDKIKSFTWLCRSFMSQFKNTKQEGFYYSSGWLLVEGPNTEFNINAIKLLLSVLFKSENKKSVANELKSYYKNYVKNTTYNGIKHDVKLLINLFIDKLCALVENGTVDLNWEEPKK